MNRSASRTSAPLPAVTLPDVAPAVSVPRHTPEDLRALEQEVEYIVDECFFTVGQVVGMRTTLTYEAVMWWREHYRARFLAAMKAFGNRWAQDRTNVTSVAVMLAERAVRYADGKPAIDLESARQAAADVERFCAIHARRSLGARGRRAADGEPVRIAGYWCPADDTRDW